MVPFVKPALMPIAQFGQMIGKLILLRFVMRPILDLLAAIQLKAPIPKLFGLTSSYECCSK